MQLIERRCWQFAACTSVAAGLYFRFIGIGYWPLAVDEYYIYRSMTFIAESGLPTFPCGGNYVRGLAYQYVTAPLLLFGVPPEVALRTLSAVAGLVALPAGYLIARRLVGERVALAIVVILALSTWHVEMARFGRMYAPFQAAFLWYVYHAYRLLEDRDLSRWRWLFSLSILGPLLWEGGIVLVLANFIPVLMTKSYWRSRHVAVSSAILVSTVLFLSVDFRFMDSGQGAQTAAMTSPGDNAGLIEKVWNQVPMLGGSVSESWLGVATGLVLTAIILYLIWRVWQEQRSVTLVSVLFLLAASMLANQLLLAAMIFAGSFLIEWIRVNDFAKPHARRLAVVLALIGFAWILYAGFLVLETRSLVPIKSLMSFPEILYSVVYPWLSNIPVMAMLVITGVGVMIAVLMVSQDSRPGMRLALMVVLLAVMIIGIAPTLYKETRYTFHFYPLMLIVACGGYVALLAAANIRQSIGEKLVVIAVVGTFALSSDFSIKHLVNIEKYESNFRVGYDVNTARHYYPRFDFRSPAQYVDSNRGPEDIVIATNVVLSHYLASTDFMFMSASDPRYRGQACENGSRERWTGLPLLDETSELVKIIDTNSFQRAWLIVDNQTLNQSLTAEAITEEAGMKKVYMSPDNRIAVYRKLVSSD